MFGAAVRAIVIAALGLGACLQVQIHSLDAGPPDAGGSPICPVDCGPESACVDAGCVDRCTAIGQTRCDGGCTDLAVDDSNCGACGKACAPGSPCRRGACQPIACPEGETACGDAGACVNLASDSNNCGVCGNRCLPGASCVDAGCPVLPCPDGFLACDSPSGGQACFDPQVDPQNCGACGDPCGPGTSCRGGICRCDPPTETCTGPDGGTICPDPLSDSQNCGGCGVACVACETCVVGACVPVPTIAQEVGLRLLASSGNNLYVRSLAAADVNGDGRVDLLFAAEENPSDSILINASIGWVLALPDGGYADPAYVVLPKVATGAPLTDIPALVESADFNGDGVGDIAALFTGGFDGGDGAELAILTGSASGAPEITYTWLGEGFGRPTALGVGDLNGDGFADVVFSTDGQLTVLVSTGQAGGFEEPVSFQPPQSSIGGIVHIGIADMNRDGRPDIVTPAGVFPQLSDAGFGAVVSPPGEGGTAYADLVAAAGQAGAFVQSSSNQVALMVSSQAGPQVAASSQLLFPNPSLFSPCSVDLNRDGLADAILLPETEIGLEACLQRGSSFDCAPTPLVGLGRPIAAWQTDEGVLVAGPYAIFKLSCPGLP